MDTPAEPAGDVIVRIDPGGEVEEQGFRRQFQGGRPDGYVTTPDLKDLAGRLKLRVKTGADKLGANVIRCEITCSGRARPPLHVIGSKKFNMGPQHRGRLAIGGDVKQKCDRRGAEDTSNHVR